MIYRPCAKHLLLEQPPLIGPRESGIAVRVRGEPALLVFRFPRDSFSTPPRPRLVCWSSSRKFAAVALSGKSIGGIEPREKGWIDFWGMPDFHMTGGSRGLLDPPTGDRWLPFIWLTNQSSRRYQGDKQKPLEPLQRAVIIDAARNLLSWISPGCHQWVTRDHIDSNVLAFSYVNSSSFVYVRVRGLSLEVILWTPQQSVRLDSIEMAAPPSCAYLSGQMINSQWHGAWCAAEVLSPHTSNVWIYRESGGSSPALITSQIGVPSGCGSIGMSYDSTLRALPKARYSLLAISPDRKHLLSMGPSRCSTVFTSRSDIVSASAATDSDLVALLTEAEDLVVLRGSGRELFRWNPAKMS